MSKSINQILRERRSIYPIEFNGSSVSDDVVREMLENANFAPNHKSNFPWRFMILKGTDIRIWVDKYLQLFQSENELNEQNQKKIDKWNKLPDQASHVIVIIMHRDPEAKTIYNEDVCAIGAAVQNIYLTMAETEGVGGYWSTGYGTYHPGMHEFLGLEVHDTLMGYFMLGSIDKKRTESGRRNIDNFIRTFNPQ